MAQPIQGVLLDIEGTTSSIRFVYDVMFPYVREHLSEFLQANWNDDSLHGCLPLLAADIDADPESWLAGQTPQQQQQIVADAVNQMMDNDVNQRRVAVFSIIYIYSLNIYSLWVPRPLRITCEALILLAVSGCGLSCPTASL